MDWKEVFAPVFVVRMLVGAVATALVAWGISFGVADWVTDRSIGILNTTVSDLSNQLQSESHQLRNEKNALAADIAQRVADAKTEQKTATDELAVEIRNLTAQLRNTTATIAGLDKSVKDIDGRLATSTQRQQEFERFVIGVVLQSGPPAPKPPEEIQKLWNIGPEVYQITAMTEGSLDLWVKAAKQ
jgi:hypothetical protein